ncbi:hypothetical protein PAAG_02287 [Paracoccidioides lutzii Pb01]|uniref:Uncharacterized protein n=1 Tax=Paracoccidioides lutzii (strain ATCC MYA-826 / Pb01) TaxID=502779 RepID=C1GVL0_PARBA|nr:hypothetical protein PAAG_02287 [Paracoccidioides lutzii Pb01]EEH40233.2 hypothetical protein PAAG_02287 [Paracoccidioides lutzii Pb01]
MKYFQGRSETLGLHDLRTKSRVQRSDEGLKKSRDTTSSRPLRRSWRSHLIKLSRKGQNSEGFLQDSRAENVAQFSRVNLICYASKGEPGRRSVWGAQGVGSLVARRLNKGSADEAQTTQDLTKYWSE